MMNEGQIEQVALLSDEESMAATIAMRSKLDSGGLKDVNRQTMVGIADRLLEMIKGAHPTMAPGFMEVDTAIYSDPALYEAEKRAIFDRLPFVAGLSRDIEKPGDYLNTSDFGTPLIVTRNKDGVVKAYVNSCRHRGAALVYDASGNTGAGFTCPYHGWSYNLDGKLLGITCNSTFGSVDKSDHGLIGLQAEERHGIIFVASKPGVTFDLDEFLGAELNQELPHWGFDKVQASKAAPIPLDGNWKLSLEAFLETYHFDYAHRDNLAHFYYGNVADLTMMGRHIRLSLPHKTIDELPTTPVDDWVPENHITLAYILFPGTILINSPQVLEFFQIVPVSPGKSIVRHACYARMDLSVPGNAEMFEMTWQSAHSIVQRQDLPYGVTTAHAAIKDGAMPKFLFGANELALQHMHGVIREALAQQAA
jgi:phenylpropionate dioxygenase-like ring-hydroxylating dioxygenase large terminal subunit